MMSKIIEAMSKSENALLESPTGTGKTLTILTAALAYQKQLLMNASRDGLDVSDSAGQASPKIFILSRTQKQIKQMIHELKTKTPYSPKMAVIGSRDHYCVHQELIRSGKNRNEGW